MKWISVKDRLPMEGRESGLLDEFVVHFTQPGNLNELTEVGNAGYITGEGWCYPCGTPYPENVPWIITHWMPRPAAPTLEEMSAFLTTDREREVYEKYRRTGVLWEKDKCKRCGKPSDTMFCGICTVLMSGG